MKPRDKIRTTFFPELAFLGQLICECPNCHEPWNMSLKVRSLRVWVQCNYCEYQSGNHKTSVAAVKAHNEIARAVKAMRLLADGADSDEISLIFSLPSKHPKWPQHKFGYDANSAFERATGPTITDAILTAHGE